MSSTETKLLHLLLPEGILNYFTLTHVITSDDTFQIYLEENKFVPDEYSNQGYICHGFYPEQSVRDFPIRGKKVLLKIKRRRWKHPQTKKLISRDWHLVASGTSLSQDFATFLKELHR